MTYFDMDAQGYRTAKGSWKVSYNGVCFNNNNSINIIC